MFVKAGEHCHSKLNNLTELDIKSLYARMRKRIWLITTIVIFIFVSLFVIKKFSKTREDTLNMQKITDYINKEMDRILTLGTRDEQNEEFRKLKPHLPLLPVRMTLTTAVFKYTSTNPVVILKRIIHNPTNKLNEDYMSRGLSGSNIVKTLKTFRTRRTTVEGGEQTLIWIFSEFLDVKLSHRTIRGDENKIRDILVGALRGLSQMHAQSIAHLDLKIGNIMGRSTPNGIVYKLIDFGYSQVMPSNGSVVIPGKNYGTYPYKPPEIVLHNTHGIKSDIWSLGAIAWFLTLQYTPFYLDNMKKDLGAYRRFLTARKNKADRGFHKFIFSRSTSDSLKDFIKICMQVDYEHRPSADELLLHPFITGRGPVAYKPSSDESNSYISSSENDSISR